MSKGRLAIAPNQWRDSRPLLRRRGAVAVAGCGRRPDRRLRPSPGGPRGRPRRRYCPAAGTAAGTASGAAPA